MKHISATRGDDGIAVVVGCNSGVISTEESTALRKALEAAEAVILPPRMLFSVFSSRNGAGCYPGGFGLELHDDNTIRRDGGLSFRLDQDGPVAYVPAHTKEEAFTSITKLAAHIVQERNNR